MNEFAGPRGDVDVLSPAEELALLDELLAEGGLAAERRPAIAPRPPHARVPLSFGQELLWLLDRATPGLTAYNVAVARRLHGELDVPALERSLSALVARHESLRTRFAVAGGEPVQVVDPPAAVALTRLDLRALQPEKRETEAAAVAAERARRPFDLARSHPLRATLVELDEREHVLLLESHHIVLDGGSLAIFLRELSACYAAYRAGREPELAPLRIQYGDYAYRQREHGAGDRLRVLLDYWRGRLAPALEPLALPTDFARPATPSFAGGRTTLQLDRGPLDRLLAFAREHGATLYMLLLAAYATVLHRYTGRANVLVGSGAGGRAESETEQTIGYFTDVLVQRVDFDGDPTFAELLARVRDGALDAYEHAGLPLETLIGELRAASGGLAPASLFEVVLTPQDAGGAPFELAGLTAEPFELDVAATKFDLALLPAHGERGLRLTLLYRADLFLPATAARLLGHVARVLEAGPAAPDTRVSGLPLLTAAEERALAAANATSAGVSLERVHRAFEAQARRVPERTAVVCGDERRTYAELNADADEIAGRLRAAGAGPGTRVGIGTQRRAATVAGLLGILKAGAAYVPLLPDAPAERLRRQLTAGGVRVVLESGAGPFAALGAAAPATVPLEPDGWASPESSGAEAAAPEGDADLAYVLFTSGSTGTPKGVAVTHGNLSNYTGAVAQVLAGLPASGDGDGAAALDGLHFGHASTLAADLGNTALWPALCTGGTLHLLPAEVTADPHRFADYTARQPLDVLKITPSHLAALLAGAPAGARILPRRRLVLGGEACSWALVDEIRRATVAAGEEPLCRVFNHYGPTETTVGAATFEVTAERSAAARAAGAAGVPIGSPLANVELHVLDARLAPLPVSIPGELVIAGAGVARGYLGAPAADDERFFTFRGRPAYRTGDRVRRLATGDLEFLGRLDGQVKLRGFRVELGEIEAVLAAHEAVAQAAVVLEEPPVGEPRLIAYARLRGAGDEPALREHLAARLPAYMLPAAFAFVDVLPLGPNGKFDRAALRALAVVADRAVRVAPGTETERQLLQVWAEAFKRPSETFGVRDDFLALGGHSLLAIRLLGKIGSAFDVRLSLRTLFAAPTVEALAREIDRSRAQRSVPARRIGRAARAAYAVQVPAGGEPPADVPDGTP